MAFRNFAIQMGSRATNLTSNQHGTAMADKQHHSAVMTDVAMIVSIDAPSLFPNYRPTINNKLKFLKFAEHLVERLSGHFLHQQPLDFGTWGGLELAVVYRQSSPVGDERRYHVLRHAHNVGIAIYRQGCRIFPVSDEECRVFWNGPTKRGESPAHRQIDLQDDDMVFLCRGYAQYLEHVDLLAREAARVEPGGDLDALLPAQGHLLRGEETAIVLSVVGSVFDRHIEQNGPLSVKHLLHLEKDGQVALEDPWPYAITKHTLVMRSYLAMLYSDASKINRFSPTIEFILRKALACPLGVPLNASLDKLSDTQYMAGAIVTREGRLRYWAINGAFLALIRHAPNGAAMRQTIFPGLEDLTHESSAISVGEVEVSAGDRILLLCPSIRAVWTQAELVALISHPSTWPEKLTVMARRTQDDRTFKNGVGLFEVVPADNNVDSF